MRSKILYFSIFLMVILWGYCFRGFLSGELVIMEDAVSYYDHVKFLVDQLSHGVYPLWEPGRQSGTPFEFFNRRMGSYNPVYLLVLLLQKSGIPSYNAYMIFLASYFFLGAAGFYFIAKKLFKNTSFAFLALLALSFCSFSSILFRSFIIYLFVPIVWFFYFLMVFYEKPQKSALMGITFTLMILVTTYIPYYFLTVAVSFIICYVVCFPLRARDFLCRCLQFIKANKMFSLVCLALLCVALVPGILFSMDLAQKEVIFPIRSYKAEVDSVVGVGKQNLILGGIPATNVPDMTFAHFKTFVLGRMYFPIFIFLLLLLGAVGRFNKRIIFLMVWGFVIFLMSLYDGSPVYPFLYKHVFFFKHFRNFHFFLWLVIVPAFILLVVEQFRLVLQDSPTHRYGKIALSIYLTLIHGGMMYFLSVQYGQIVTSYVAVTLSYLFCIGMTWRPVKDTWWPLLFLVIVTVQPIEVYHYLHNNTDKGPTRTRYDRPYRGFAFVRNLIDGGQYSGGINRLDTSRPQDVRSQMHFGVSWFNDFMVEVDPVVFKKYMNNKFYVYDKVQPFRGDWKVFQDDLYNDVNVAYIFSGEEVLSQSVNNAAPDHVRIVTENVDDFQVVQYDVNTMKIKTNFMEPKFVVYADNYHSRWQASVNGKSVNIYRVNISSKGLWVGPGENIVVFHYGQFWQYFLHVGILLIFYLTFLYLVWLGIRRDKL